MYKIVIILAFVCLAGCAPKLQTIVSDNDVQRIVKSLSADDKAGRPATSPEIIERSIVFIEKEFKRIGLSPMTSLTSYRQEFERDFAEVRDGSVTVNNNSIDRNNFFVSSRQPSMTWRNNNITYIRKSDNFLAALRKTVRSTDDNVMIVDTAHAKIFSMVRSQFMGKRILSDDKRGSTVVILSSDSIQSITGSATQQTGKIKFTNIVGMLPASSPTKESVVFSAHYDHIGIRTAVDGDSIANGADDDASGTTAVIALAELYKKTKIHKRNLIFVAFTAEELGGYGSQHFSSKLNPDDIVAMFNIEMIGKQSKWGRNSAFITGFDRSNFGTILQKNLEGTEFKFYPDPYTEQNLFYRSDNATLARLGVPAHSISTDQIDSDKFYHTVNDEFETLDIQNITTTIRAIYTSSRSIVDGSDRPTRIAKEQ
jgi:hypothetical protein